MTDPALIDAADATSTLLLLNGSLTTLLTIASVGAICVIVRASQL